MYSGQHISTPPRLPGSYGMSHGIPMVPNHPTSNAIPSGIQPTNNVTVPASASKIFFLTILSVFPCPRTFCILN